MPPMEMPTDGVEIAGQRRRASRWRAAGRATFERRRSCSFPRDPHPADRSTSTASRTRSSSTPAPARRRCGRRSSPRITADGRAQLSRAADQDGDGSDHRVGHARAHADRRRARRSTNPAVMTIGDTLLDGIQTEVHHPVDGLLGGNFLREFMVTVDYPRRHAAPAALHDRRRSSTSSSASASSSASGAARTATRSATSTRGPTRRRSS